MRRIICVLTAPGRTALTRTPEAAASAAAVRVKPMTACLLMMQGDIPGAPMMPASEDVFMIAPDRWAFITGSDFCNPRKTPLTLTL